MNIRLLRKFRKEARNLYCLRKKGNGRTSVGMLTSVSNIYYYRVMFIELCSYGNLQAAIFRLNTLKRSWILFRVEEVRDSIVYRLCRLLKK